ncbi:hypothetical protein L7F22_044225 [Adiantum nelumboides]|nr:hypothetical protein [Adiantum nelumboides]
MPPKNDGEKLSHTLSVSPTEADSSSAFESLRVFVHPSLLRTLRIQIASPAAVILSSSSGIEHCFIADIWPRSTIDVEQICVPASYIPNQSSSWQAKILNIASITGTETLETPNEIRLKIDQDGTPDAEKLSLLNSQAREHLMLGKFITEGMSFTLPDCSVTVTSIGSLSESSLTTNSLSAAVQKTISSAVRASRSMKITIEHSKGDKHISPSPQVNGALQKESAYATLGGLNAQIEELRKLVELPLKRPDLFKQYGLPAPRGLLLFGPPGTGKTTLAYSAAKSCVPATSIETISGPELTSSLHGGTERALRKVFARARKSAPSVVIIDEIDALAPRRDGDVEGAGEVEKRVVATLLTLMDGLGANGKEDSRVVVIAATNRPNALDPALRRPGRLDREIEVGIPSSTARLEILQVLLKGVPHSLSFDTIKAVADRTHGYVGADLSALVREAGMQALTRDMTSSHSDLNSQLENMSLTSSHSNGLTESDFLFAQAKIRPSAMREISLELPKVTWDDIAPGQSGLDVQRKIRECVEWPLKHRSTMQRLGIDAPRGVLLYGPPGCSKTLIARALASESGLNFVAVKGPELLNKYVGESERALRDVFRKARAAAPSIIFFDEIDGMTTARGSGDGAGGDRLITTLLNEMDGVEQLSNVIVIAATNRPDVLDAALLRPGRLDRLLYVGPPDIEARKQILSIRTRDMALAKDVNLGLIADLTHGCSGAEVVSICNDAGLRAMNENLKIEAVRHDHLEFAAKQVRRRITPQMIRQYESWRDQLVL